MFSRKVLSFLFMSLLITVTSANAAEHPLRQFGMFPGNNKVWIQPKNIGAPKQSWDDYCPPCTIKPTSQCKARRCQTKNIVRNHAYHGLAVSSDTWMKLANHAALTSAKKNDGPFAAVIIQIDDKTGKVIRYWVSHNQVVKNHDPTAHAEIMAIREASHDLGVINLGHINKKSSILPQPGTWSHCIIYSSSEPCPMCLAAIYWSGIGRLYFAATRYDAAVQGVNFSDALIYKELNLPYFKRQHMIVKHSITNNSLDAFNFFKRNPVPRYGQTENGTAKS